MTTSVALISILLGLASDHIDGVPVASDPQTDLTDLYAFPTPDKEGGATVVLDVYPGVGPKGHFSDAVDYRIFVRRVEVDRDGRSLFKTDAASQLAMTCSFVTPHHDEDARGSDRVRCELVGAKDRDAVEGEVGRVIDGAARLYAGRRLDPFFLRIASFQGVRKRRGFKASTRERAQRSNGLDTATVLTVAVEIDLARFFGDAKGMFAVAAESVRNADGVVIDRIGRAEMVNLSLHRLRRDDVAVKEYYNREIESFTAAENISPVVRDRLRGNIAAYDELVAGRDWKASDLDRLVDMLLEDFLVLDPSAPCSAARNDYLEIERAYLRGAAKHATCGGRRLGDNVMSTVYGLYLGGLDSDPKAFRDGVNRPPRIDATFPYLTEAPRRMKLKTRLVLKILARYQDGKPSWRERKYRG